MLLIFLNKIFEFSFSGVAYGDKGLSRLILNSPVGHSSQVFL